MTDSADINESMLFDRIAGIIEAARSQVSRSVNTAMVHAYWFTGQEIVEVEQQGKERAGYGEKVLDRLSARLNARFGLRLQRAKPAEYEAVFPDLPIWLRVA